MKKSVVMSLAAIDLLNDEGLTKFAMELLALFGSVLKITLQPWNRKRTDVKTIAVRTRIGSRVCTL